MPSLPARLRAVRTSCQDLPLNSRSGRSMTASSATCRCGSRARRPVGDLLRDGEQAEPLPEPVLRVDEARRAPHRARRRRRRPGRPARCPRRCAAGRLVRQGHVLAGVVGATYQRFCDQVPIHDSVRTAVALEQLDACARSSMPAEAVPRRSARRARWTPEGALPHDEHAEAAAAQSPTSTTNAGVGKAATSSRRGRGDGGRTTRRSASEQQRGDHEDRERQPAPGRRLRSAARWRAAARRRR